MGDNENGAFFNEQKQAIKIYNFNVTFVLNFLLKATSFRSERLNPGLKLSAAQQPRVEEPWH